MSLLLDALKKAAQDKKSQSGTVAGAPETNSPDESELSLDLSDVEPVSDDVHEANAPASEDTAQTAGATQDWPQLADDITPPPADIVSTPVTQPKPAAEPPAPAVTETPAPVAVPPAATTTAKTTEPLRMAQPEPRQNNTATSSGKSRDALELMINKGRQDAEHQRNRIRLGVLLVCLLLIFTTGFYFYFTSEPAAVPTSDAMASDAPEESAVAPVETTQSASTPVQPAVTRTAPTSSRIAPPTPRRNTTRTPEPVQKPAETPQFTRSVRTDPIETLLAQAYEKFQAGDYKTAQHLYAQVLERESDNRDGMLGVAAVAMKQQQPDLARQKYLQLLQLDPKDSLARAGLSSIDMNIRDESQLKLMLREQPGAAHLHFALGALYAGETRWAEAQQAYFNAVSLDNGNADYAYNLAVSLDRLGRYKPAKSWYEKALQLQSSNNSFSTDTVRNRIDQISRQPEESNTKP